MLSAWESIHSIAFCLEDPCRAETVALASRIVAHFSFRDPLLLGRLAASFDEWAKSSTDDVLRREVAASSRMSAQSTSGADACVVSRPSELEGPTELRVTSNGSSRCYSVTSQVDVAASPWVQSQSTSGADSDCERSRWVCNIYGAWRKEADGFPPDGLIVLVFFGVTGARNLRFATRRREQWHAVNGRAQVLVERIADVIAWLVLPCPQSAEVHGLPRPGQVLTCRADGKMQWTDSSVTSPKE